MTSKSSSGVAAVERALRIIDAFRETDESALSLASLAAITGYYKSTILRLLASLEKYGYIRQISDGRYKLGHALAELGNIYHESFELREVIEPVLASIVEQANESASFLIRKDESQQILFRHNTNLRVRDSFQAGDSMLIADGGASAKVFLKFEDLVLDRLTPKNFCESSFGERVPEMAGVAAPVFGEGNKFIGVVSVTGPSYRFNKQSAGKIIKILNKEVRELCLILGANQDLFAKF